MVNDHPHNSFFLVFNLIGISADFDPVHKGHEKLIKEALKIAESENKKVVVYLNKGFSANHAPFFVNFEARREMALALGADEVRSFEGLHHRLILSYSISFVYARLLQFSCFFVAFNI